MPISVSPAKIFVHAAHFEWAVDDGDTKEKIVNGGKIKGHENVTPYGKLSDPVCACIIEERRTYV